MASHDSRYNIQEMLEEELLEKPTPEIKILNAAIAQFSEKGFHATKTKDIASLAGVAEGTIFRYFKTKEDILLRLYPLAIKIIMPKMVKDLTQKILKQEHLTAESLATFIISDRLSMLEANRKLLLAILPELMYRRELHQVVKEHLYIPIQTTLIQFSERVLDASYNITPKQFAQFVMSTLIGFALQGYLMATEVTAPISSKEIETYVTSMSHNWHV